MWAQAVLFAASPGGVLSGVVVDDKGAPIPNAVVVYSTVPKVTEGPDGRRVTAGPQFGAQVRTGADGSFAINGLQSATYDVCVYGVKDTHLGSCEWQGLTRVNVASGEVVRLNFRIPEGTMLTFQVQDLRGQIRDLADLYTKGGRIPVFGSNFAIGVWAGSRYASAKLVSKAASLRVYQLPIPKTATVRLFLDTQLTVLDAASALAPSRLPGAAISAQGLAEITTSLTVP